MTKRDVLIINNRDGTKTEVEHPFYPMQLMDAKIEIVRLTARLALAEAVCEVADTLSRQCWQADCDGDLSEYIDGNVEVDILHKIKAWRETKENTK